MRRAIDFMISVFIVAVCMFLLAGKSNGAECNCPQNQPAKPLQSATVVKVTHVKVKTLAKRVLTVHPLRRLIRSCK